MERMSPKARLFFSVLLLLWWNFAAFSVRRPPLGVFGPAFYFLMGRPSWASFLAVLPEMFLR